MQWFLRSDVCGQKHDWYAIIHRFVVCGGWACPTSCTVPMVPPPTHIRYLTSAELIFHFFLSLQHFAQLEVTWSEQRARDMSGSSTAFSNDGVEVISRKVEPSPAMEAGLLKEGQRDLRRYYEVERCSAFIKTYNFQKVSKKRRHFYFILHLSPPPDSPPVSWFLASWCCQSYCCIAAGVCREAVLYFRRYFVWKVAAC